MALTPEQIQAIQAVANAIIDSVKAAGSIGAPGGVIYAALMGHGMNLSQFTSIMDALVRANRLTKQGDLYFAP